MSYCLYLDTATEMMRVALCKDGAVCYSVVQQSGRDHIAKINFAIEDVCAKANITIRQISAVAVFEGPGSYTGLRVALSTAKGLCVALQIPLICINLFELLLHYVPSASHAVFQPMQGEYILWQRGDSTIRVVSLEDAQQQVREGSHVAITNNLNPAIEQVQEVSPTLLFEEAVPIILQQKYLIGNFADVYNSEPLYGKPTFIKMGSKSK